MSFNPHSIERLRELGRQLPKPLPLQASPSKDKPQEREQLHKIETETDPDALFHELMKASEDGTIPPHLVARLKEAEESQSKSKSLSNQNQPTINQNRQKKSSLNNAESNLYLSFKELLREEGDEIQSINS